jgi:MFS family permease
MQTVNRVNQFPVKATLMAISTLTVMAGATIAPALPQMQAHFATVAGADYLVRLALTLPALFIAIGAPIAGLIIDRMGRKPLLILSLVLYGLAGSSGFFLASLPTILVGRALLGISVAGVMTTATTLIADYYSGAARAQVLGLQAGFMGLGGVLFLTVGGTLADLNWRLPFLIYLVALGLALCAAILLPEPNRVVDQASSTSEASALPLGLLVLTYGMGILLEIIFYLIPVQLPFYLQQLYQATATQSGLAIALSSLCSAATSLLYRRFKAKLSFIAIYGITFLNIGMGYWLIGMGGTPVQMAIALAIAGTGLGLVIPNMNLCLTSVTPDAARGRVLAGVTTSIFLGQFLSPLLSQPLSQMRGLAETYRIAGGVTLIMAVIMLIVYRRWK